MLFLNLIIQDWKKGIRSQGFYKNLAVSIILGIFALYMAAVFLFLGFSLDEILEKANNSLNPLELFNGAMLYIVLISLIIRFLLQQLNTFNLPPYQVLPVKRDSLINFLLLKPLTSVVNYFFLLIIVPFTLQSVVHYYSIAVGVRFILCCVLLVWFNSLMAAFLKRQFGSGFLSFLTLALTAGGLATLEFFRVFSLFNTSRIIFDLVILNPVGLLLPFGMVCIAFMLNKWFFSRNYYPEKFNIKARNEKAVASDLSFLNRFGMIGEIISLEIKLILRHKRTKGIMYMSSVFLFYGLIFYTNKVYEHQIYFLFFCASFMTGLLMLMFGQWTISWDSNHFDSLMTRNIPVKTYIEANYYLMVAFSIICFVVTTPYFLFGQKIIYLHLSSFLYNIGVNVYFLLFFATYNTRKVDLSKSSAMNYQGTTYKSFLILLPIMFLPMLLVGQIAEWLSPRTALLTVSALGIAGIVLRKPILNLCVRQFNARKYKMAEGFRESE